MIVLGCILLLLGYLLGITVLWTIGLILLGVGLILLLVGAVTSRPVLGRRYWF